MATIAIFNALPQSVRDALESAGHTLVSRDQYGTREAVVRHGRAARVVITNGEGGLSADEIAGLPDVELVCAIGVGYEAVDLAALASRGITLTNGRGTNDTAVADHTFGLMLAVAGGIVLADRMVRAGDWGAFASNSADYPFTARRRGLFGKRLGIIGLGRIGTKIADRAHLGFEMEVAYHGRQLKAESPYTFMPSLVEMAGWTDFLVVAAPGGPGTRHLVDDRVLSALGPDGFLINIGRGSVVDTDALVAALREERIAGAGLDVVDGEPDIPPALLDLENVVLTPHMAGRGPEPVAVMTRLLVANIAAFVDGQPLLTPIDLSQTVDPEN